jgi:hypothetical protein
MEVTGDGTDSLSMSLKEYIAYVHRKKVRGEVAHAHSEPPVDQSPEGQRAIEVLRHNREMSPGGSADSGTMVECPICGAMILGRNDDDLPVQLRNHMISSHHT